MSASTTSEHVVVDPALFRPAEVDVLLGDPAKARDEARLGAGDHARGDDRRDGGGRPPPPPRPVRSSRRSRAPPLELRAVPRARHRGDGLRRPPPPGGAPRELSRGRAGARRADRRRRRRRRSGARLRPHGRRGRGRIGGRYPARRLRPPRRRLGGGGELRGPGHGVVGECGRHARPRRGADAARAGMPAAARVERRGVRPLLQRRQRPSTRGRRCVPPTPTPLPRPPPTSRSARWRSAGCAWCASGR